MNPLLMRSVFDFLISMILLIQIILTAKYYYITKIPDYLIFSVFFLAIDINSLFVGLGPFVLLKHPSFFNLMFETVLNVTWLNAWNLLIIHNILFYSVNKRKKEIIIIIFAFWNAFAIYLWFFGTAILWLIFSPVEDMYDGVVLIITFFNYFYNARITEINFSTTKKVRNLWLTAISIALVSALMQFFGSFLLPGIFLNYVIADFLFLIAILVIFFISARYPQSFLLSKNHILRAFHLYSKLDKNSTVKNSNENIKLEQIKDYLLAVRQNISVEDIS